MVWVGLQSKADEQQVTLTGFRCRCRERAGIGATRQTPMGAGRKVSATYAWVSEPEGRSMRHAEYESEGFRRR